MQNPPTPIAPGAHIVVRDATWRVVQVDTTSSGRAAWKVVGVSEIVRDQEAIFLEEYEGEVRPQDPRETRLVADPSPGHRGALVTIEALLRDRPPETDRVSLGHRAAMDVMDYQLDPARLALGQLRPRILIADAVGLGKTLEAGILLSELIRRGRAKRVLVVTVKAMLTQFQKELWSRFTIPLVRLDSEGLQRIRERIPTNHNPFYHFDRVIISVDTLKQKNALRAHLERARWDVIVIDEAHNVAERGHNASLRAQVAALLSSRSDALILLSATPHDGRPRSFASLMNMLDPTAIADPERYTPDEIRGLYVRRFKGDVADQVRDHFPERQIRQVPVSATPAEEAAFDALDALALESDRAQSPGAVLFRTTLEKALFSSPMAASQTARARIDRLRERKDSARLSGDIQALAALADALDAVGPGQFSRYQRLVRLVRDELDWSPRRRDDRLVIFTERIETLRLLERHLPADLGISADAVAVLHGSMSDVDQQAVVGAFGQPSSPVRVLVASDVASEGINLHYLCHRMIHFDIPWSLMVFQQRNGRIDRYGQPRAPQILYLVGQSGNPRIRGDQRILELLIEKDAAAQHNIGDPSALLGAYDVEAQEEQTALAMQQGLSPEAFDQRTSLDNVDPLELLLSMGAEAPPAPPPQAPLSLFPSDRAWLVAALEGLRAQDGAEPLRFQADHDSVTLEIPRDLRRRFDRLPAEILPADRRVCLVEDKAVVQGQLAASRAEDGDWPHYLWPLHPVLGWVADRVRGRFGRHSAPALTVGALAADEAAFIVSGLIPNRQAQPVVHRWYCAVFRGDRFERLERFEALLRRTALGSTPLPNPGPPRIDALQALLPRAVREVEARVIADRDALDAQLQVRLRAHHERLSVLRSRQEKQVQIVFQDRITARDHDARLREERRVQRLFDDTERWVRDALSTERQPFLQVIAVLCGAGWRAGGAA